MKIRNVCIIGMGYVGLTLAVILAKKMFAISGFTPTQVDAQEAPAGCVMRRCPDISKLKSFTGFKPETDLDTGLKKTMEWYQQYVEQRNHD